MESVDIGVQVLLGLAQDPLLEVAEVQLRGGAPRVPLQPLYVELEVLLQGVLVEYAVYHVTAEQF